MKVLNKIFKICFYLHKFSQNTIINLIYNTVYLNYSKLSQTLIKSIKSFKIFLIFYKIFLIMSPLRTEILATLLEILSDFPIPRTKILATPLVSINCCLPWNKSWLRAYIYIYIYKNPWALSPKASEFLCELMYFYWKFLILETFYKPPHANQGGGRPRLYQGEPGAQAPRWLRPWGGLSHAHIFLTDNYWKSLESNPGCATVYIGYTTFSYIVYTILYCTHIRIQYTAVYSLSLLMHNLDHKVNL